MKLVKPYAFRRMRRWLLVLVVLALVLQGCGNDDAAPDDGGPTAVPGAEQGPDPTAAPDEAVEGPDPTAAPDEVVEGPDPTAAPDEAEQGPDPTADPGGEQGPDPAEYTQQVVQAAIDMYESEGLDAAVAHYSDPANIDGQWYVFIVDGDGALLAHYQPERVGQSLHGWIGTDINGYEFGSEMMSADHNGKWVPYVFTNPAGGVLDAAAELSFELKNAWVVLHDGLLFGSGWYISAEEFLPELIAEAAERYRSGGLEATLAFYNNPQGISAGLETAVKYYNSTDTVDGYFTGIIAADDGEILSHIDPSIIGSEIEDLLGPAVSKATPEGTWITAEDNDPGAGGPDTMRVWLVDVDGTLIGGGWYTPSGTP